MDTKLKSVSHSFFAKALAFIIAIICFTGAMFSFWKAASYNGFLIEDLTAESYYESRSFAGDISDIFLSFQNFSNYKSEKYVKSGATITNDRISNRKDMLYSEFESSSPSYDPNLTYEENFAIFESVEADKIAKIKDELIADDLHSFSLLLEDIERNIDDGVTYYYRDGDVTFSNTESSSAESFKSYPSYVISERGRTIAYPNEAEVNLFNSGFYIPTFDDSSKTAYVGFEKDYIDKKVSEFEKKRGALREELSKLAGFIAGLFVSFIYLAVTVGRNSFKDSTVHLNRFNKLYNDIAVFLCFTVAGIWFITMSEFFYGENFNVVIVPTAVLGAIGLLLVLSLVTHIKNKTLVKHSLIYTIASKFFGFFKNVYNSGPVSVKVVSLAILYPLAVAATFFMFPVTIGLGAWFAYKKAREFSAVSDGVSKIKSGDIHYSIELSGDGEFKKLADNINNIADGLANAVDGELKSEKMKTELITNVSHDIRTPLTSIITYIDLLKQESDSEKRNEYIEVLEQKSQRLKTLTDDLFEAAKATSGNMPVEVGKIDLVSLMEQGLGELGDSPKKLQFKLDSSVESLPVSADGKLLWRAVENLLSNVYKYALPGSRVYIDFSDTDSYASMAIKNVSESELNISSEELLERFKRGDEARTTEGSGLGLSIAQSLVEMQGGMLQIDIDGDLFKATVKMPKYSS